MKFLEQRSNNNFILRLNVKTNSRSQKIINNGDVLTIFLKSKPVQNKANKELITLIGKKLNLSSNQIQIISGSKSKDKLIKITFLRNIEEEEIIEKLFL
ncbi:hypothetical protein ES703_31760 [subsurface metagenome]